MTLLRRSSLCLNSQRLFSWAITTCQPTRSDPHSYTGHKSTAMTTASSTRTQNKISKSKRNYFSLQYTLSDISYRCLHNGSCMHQTSDEGGTSFTHFGYKEIEEKEKVKKVYEVFENVAKSYDVMNDAMSAGAHRLWKSKFVDQLHVKPNMKVLDMAGGTGDIAFKMFDSFAAQHPNQAPELNPDIVISDINQHMLDVGKERAAKMGIDHLFQWVQANAEELPFDDETFDVYTIAFGIRNTTHINKVLDEAFRVLKIGGRFSCLEFSHVDNVILSDLYDAYSFQVIPVMGEVLAKDWDSYQYLVESIRKFPKQDTFAEMIYNAGFSNVRYENMTFGVVAVHDGFKI